MSESSKDLAARAAKQASDATKNSGRAVEALGEEAIDAATSPTASATTAAALSSVVGGLLIGLGVNHLRNAVTAFRGRKVG